MIEIIKSGFLRIKPALSKREILVFMLVILAAAYALAPRFWEPGGESLKNWSVARVFRETGGFPVFFYGPLYNMYLQLFSFFDYPLSIQLEHFVTHTFAYTAIFLLLRGFLPPVPALLLTCAWIPGLWTLEGGARVAGMGFLALYLRAGRTSGLSKRYFPLTLSAAALLDSVFMPFLIGHIVGSGITRYRSGVGLFNFTFIPKPKEALRVIVIIAMAALVICTVLFQSERPDQNAYGFLYPWTPVPVAEAVSLSFFQIANYKYVMRNVPEEEWPYQDWYNTNKEVFGGASGILQAILKKPKVYFKNVFAEFPAAVMVPADYIAGFRRPLPPVKWFLILLSWSVLPFCFYKVFRYFNENGSAPHIYSVVFGAGAALGVQFFLMWFKDRYLLALLPVGLMATAHFGPVVQSGINRLRRMFSRQPNNLFTVNPGPAAHKALFICGLFFILLGLFANERVLTPALSLDGSLEPATRIKIWFSEFLFIACGISLIAKRELLASFFRQITSRPYSNTRTWLTNAITLSMALSILTSGGFLMQYRPLSQNPFLLEGRMSKARGALLASVDKDTKVLAMEMPWIRAFTDAGLDNAFHALYLPPFEDKTGKTRKFLEDLDVIWLSDQFSKKTASVGTQTYMRYELHVAPFLKTALARGWTAEKIEGFGGIYRRPGGR